MAQKILYFAWQIAWLVISVAVLLAFIWLISP